MVRERVLRVAGEVSRRLPPGRTKNRVGRAVAYGLGNPSAVSADLNGVRLWLRPANRTASGAFWSGEYEDHVVDLLVALLLPSMTFVDIGANVGLIGVRVAVRARPKRSFLIEPVPANVALLERSVEENGLRDSCRVLPYGLDDHSRDGELYVDAHGAGSGNAGPGPAYGRTRTGVSFRRLDELVEAPVDVIKIDVEGAEPAALRGATTILSRSRPCIFGEFADDQSGTGTALVDAMAVVEPLDYAVFAFVGSRHMVRVPVKPGRGDVLLVPPEFVPPLGWRFDGWP